MSVRPSVGQSVDPSFGPSVLCFSFKSSKLWFKVNQNNVRALKRASSYLGGPCPTVAASVGRVSGLVGYHFRCGQASLIALNKRGVRSSVRP